MTPRDFDNTPSGEAFAVLNPPSDPTGEWWVDLEEVDLDPDPEPTDEAEFLRLDLMGELELMRFNHRLTHRRFFGLGYLAAPAHYLRYLLTRSRFDRRLHKMGHRPIPRHYKPGVGHGRF